MILGQLIAFILAKGVIGFSSLPSFNSGKTICTHLKQSSIPTDATAPLVSARVARIIAPVSSLSCLLFPSASLAKSSSGGAFDQSIASFFPGSIPTTTVQLRVLSTLRKREYRQYNTIMGTSLSGDEILNTPTSLVNQLKTKLLEAKDGGVYSLGGLGGIPFAGTAGMADLMSHVPTDGKLVLIYGPNIGINKDGGVGSVERIGKGGADETLISRTYHNILAGNKSTGTGMNFEEDYIIEKMKSMNLKDYDQKGDNFAIAEVTNKLYALISDLVGKQVESTISSDPNFWSKLTEITLIGGVIVNRGHGSGTDGGDDFFQPLTMKALFKNGVADLYDEVFGDLATRTPK